MAESQRYKQLREKLGLTQQELADKLGVHRTTIVNREKGHVPLTPEMFFALSGIERVTQ